MMPAVFVPSLMGAGILVSGAILLADVVRRYLPQRGMQRRHRVAMGAFHVVADAALWAEREVSAGDLLHRVARSRLTYGAWFALGGIAAVGMPAAAAAAYRDELGPFHLSPWMIGLGAAAAVVFGIAAVVSLTLVAFAPRPPRPIGRLIAGTVIGRFEVPDPLEFTDVPEGVSCEEP